MTTSNRYKRYISVYGHQESLLPYLATHRIFVSPIISGTGINTKNVIAMNAGLPVITTSIGAVGLHVNKRRPLNPEAPLIVIPNDNATAYVEAIVRLYNDANLWQKLSGLSSAHVKKHFQWRPGPFVQVLKALNTMTPPDSKTLYKTLCRKSSLGCHHSSAN